MKISALLISTSLFLFASCKKSETTNPPPQQDSYLTTSAGSTWNYHQTDASGATPVSSDYTLTSTSRDSTINGRSYHVFTNSNSGNQYLTISGSDYYQFDSLPAALGTAVFERLYLKDAAAGTSWTQNLSVTLPGVPVPVPVTLSYNIAEKGISRTVNGTSYTDVIHVATSISSSFIPSASLSTDINTYYAKKYGLIEASTIIHLDFMGLTEDVNLETKLVSATIL